MNKVSILVVKVLMGIGVLAVIDKITTKSYKDGVKRGIEMANTEKTVNETTNVED